MNDLQAIKRDEVTDLVDQWMRENGIVPNYWNQVSFNVGLLGKLEEQIFNMIKENLK